MTDFENIIKKAKELEEKMKDSKEKIKNIQVSGSSGLEDVKLVLNGDSEIVKLEISDKILRENKEILQDLIIAAFNNAKEKLKVKTLEEISKSTSELNIPGFKWPL
ncbi:YbaB/EbfC family nucleoid-associated protein [Candidatus Pelagibacter sp.]|nr:YbaB/EbfC family nucleoid-associated protein [Candidatus Pelagibacter sp.]